MPKIKYNALFQAIHLIKKLLEPSFTKFFFVGGLGFLVDAGLLTFMMGKNWNIIFSRACSFTSAVTVTWIVNRIWTFKSSGRLTIHREYTYYFSTQIVGAIINLSVFFMFINIYPELRNMPLKPLAFGAAISLVFNFILSRKFIFINGK